MRGLFLRVVQCFLDNVTKGVRCVSKFEKNLIQVYLLLFLGWLFTVVRLVFPSTWHGSHLDNILIFNFFFFGRTVSSLSMLQKSSSKLPVKPTPRSRGDHAWQMARKNCTTFHFQVPRREARRQNWNSSTGTQQPTKVGQMHADESE